jgi:hypothetical protein
MGNVATVPWRTAELEKVITLFAFFNLVNISERLFSNDADDSNLTTSNVHVQG